MIVNVYVFLGGFRVQFLRFTNADAITFGRLRTSDVVLENESVGMTHAALNLKTSTFGSQFLLEVFSPRQQTRLNGRQIPDQHHLVDHGDVIEMGAYTIVIQFEDRPFSHTFTAPHRDSSARPGVVLHQEHFDDPTYGRGDDAWLAFRQWMTDGYPIWNWNEGYAQPIPETATKEMFAGHCIELRRLDGIGPVAFLFRLSLEEWAKSQGAPKAESISSGFHFEKVTADPHNPKAGDVWEVRHQGTTKRLVVCEDQGVSVKMWVGGEFTTISRVFFAAFLLSMEAKIFTHGEVPVRLQRSAPKRS